jgi:transposase
MALQAADVPVVIASASAAIPAPKGMKVGIEAPGVYRFTLCVVLWQRGHKALRCGAFRKTPGPYNRTVS